MGNVGDDLRRVLRPSEMLIFALRGVESNTAAAAAIPDAPRVTVRIAQESLGSFKNLDVTNPRAMVSWLWLLPAELTLDGG